MSRENVEIVRRMVEVFNAGDVEGLSAVMAPDGRIVPLRAALEDTVYSGPDAARQFWEAAMESWSTLRLDIGELRDCGERVLALGSIKGKARGTEAEVETPAAWIVTVRNGRISESRTYTSQTEALEAVGLSE